MFTGIIEQLGRVVSREMFESQTLRLGISSRMTQLVMGESIAIDGVCLTVLPDSIPELILFDVSPLTQAVTTLSTLKPGDDVHMERALRADARLGGQMLTGHVEGKFMLREKKWHGDCLEMIWGGLSHEMAAYVFPKGSIALAGVSLTVNEVTDETLSVMLIPHTLKHTHLKQIEVGQPVNVEGDYFAKVIAHQLKREEVCHVG